MNANIRSNLWQAPSAQSFLKGCVSDICSGKSLCIVLPNYMDAEEFGQILLLENPLRDRRLRVVPGCEDETATSYEVESYLCSALGFEFFEDFLKDTERPDLVFVSGFEQQPLSVQQGWFDLLRRWANAFHGMTLCSSLLFVVQAITLKGLSLPSQDTHLKYRLWHGIPSIVETQLLCRMSTESSKSPENQWREAILPALVGGDLDLLDWMWDEVLGSLEGLLNRLSCYHPEHWNGSINVSWKDLERGWSEFKSPEPGNPRSDDSWLNFWGTGMISETHEYGREIHPTLLIQNHFETKAMRRLWRGQAALMLPMVDEICLGLDEVFTRSYGNRNWIWYHDADNMETKPPLEMRDFQVVLENRRTEPRCKSWYARWYEDVKRTRELRNNLAHGSAVTFSDYKKLHYFLDKVRAEYP